MIDKFSTVYAGHVDLGDMGQQATPANERRCSNDHPASVFAKTEAVARCMKAFTSESFFYHLAESRERAVREITPWYEEHVKMFGPLGFVPGITPAQLEASTRRGGWGAAGVPTVEHYGKVGAWFAGPPEELVAYLKSLETTYPGLEHVHLSHSRGTPQNVMLEQLAWLGKEVMPSFVAR
jgi:hypothetical protein